MKSKLLITAVIGFASAITSYGQTVVASDNAGNYSSWPQIVNNGTGFSSWSYNNTIPNGGASGQFEGASGNINSGNGNAFGFYANSAANAQANAILNFTQGSLVNLQDFSIQMQNNNVTDNGGQVGFDLQNSSGNNIMQFYFNGGQNDYYLNVFTGISTSVQVDTGVSFSAGSSGLTLSYDQLSGDNWIFNITTGSGTTTLSSASTSDQIWQNSISKVDMFSLNGGSSRTLGDNANLYFNTLTITDVPEPGTIALMGISGLAMVYMVRRRR